jgi:hypothetical protein
LPVDTSIIRAVVANGVIYADVFAVDPSTLATTETLNAYPLDCADGCQPLLTMPVDDGLTEEVVSGPIVSNGQVLYGTTTGRVAALTP